MNYWALLLATLLVAALAGCGGGRSAPRPGPAPEAELTLAGKALERYATAVAGPADAAGLRQSLDLVALALASGDGQRESLLAAEAELITRLIVLEQTAGPTPGAAISVPQAMPTDTPVVMRDQPLRPAATTAQVISTKALPPSPTFVTATRKSFEGSGASGHFASCIDVQVVDGGAPVAGAVIGINNGDLSYQDQTNQDGYSGRCGLGASTWSVVLFWTPARGQVQNVATTVYISGAPEQRAAVVFEAQ